MIPIVSITDLVNGIIAAVIAVRLSLMYDGNKRDGLLEFMTSPQCKTMGVSP